MFPVRNIIRGRTDKKWNIGVINNGYETYINRLAEAIEHNLIVFGSHSWRLPYRANNVYLRNNVPQLDAILCFDRAGAFEAAYPIRDSAHAPLIVVDMVPATSFNVEKQQLLQRCGDVSIGLDEGLTKHWMSAFTVHAATIPFFARKHQILSRKKVLVEPAATDEFLESVQINPGGALLTRDMKEAALYIHPYNHVTPTLLDAMASQVPVVTVEQTGLSNLINNELCVLIKDMSMINDPSFIDELANFSELDRVVKAAAEHASSQHSPIDVMNKWKSLFSYMSNQIFLR